MRTLKTYTAVAVVALTMGVVGVSAASATTTFDGTISGSTWAGDVGPCDFSITATGGPAPAEITLDGATFVGRSDGSNAPCDETSLSIDNNITATFSSTTTGNLASGIQVHDNDSGCTYTTSGAIMINSTSGASGTWSGSGSATSGDFPCFFAPASISVTGGTFT